MHKCQQWEGVAGTLGEHLARTCEFALVPCPRKCRNSGKTERIVRRELHEHLTSKCPNRDFQCAHCKVKDTYARIQLHDEECELKMLPCPNGCTQSVQRRHIEHHVLTQCESTLIACRFKNIGCTKQMKRAELPAHEQNYQCHLLVALDAVAKLQDSVAELREELRDTKAQLQFMKPVRFAVLEYRKKKRRNEVFTSPSFYTRQNGYKMVVKVYVNGIHICRGTHVSITVLVCEGRHDAELKWPFVGTVTFALLNQLEDENHHIKSGSPTIASNLLVGKDYGVLQFISHSELAHDPVKNKQYLKDDTLYFGVSVREAGSKPPWLECTAV